MNCQDGGVLLKVADVMEPLPQRKPAINTYPPTAWTELITPSTSSCRGEGARGINWYQIFRKWKSPTNHNMWLSVIKSAYYLLFAVQSVCHAQGPHGLSSGFAAGKVTTHLQRRTAARCEPSTLGCCQRDLGARVTVRTKSIDREYFAGPKGPDRTSYEY